MSLVPVFLLISLLNNIVVKTLLVSFIFKLRVNFAILVHSDASIGEVAFSLISSDTRWLVFLLILPFLHRLVLRHEFILKKEIFEFKSTMFAKLFGVKAPFSSKVIAQNPKRNRVGDTKIKLNTSNEDLMRMVLKL